MDCHHFYQITKLFGFFLEFKQKTFIILMQATNPFILEQIFIEIHEKKEICKLLLMNEILNKKVKIKSI